MLPRHGGNAQAYLVLALILFGGTIWWVIKTTSSPQTVLPRFSQHEEAPTPSWPVADTNQTCPPEQIPSDSWDTQSEAMNIDFHDWIDLTVGEVVRFTLGKNGDSPDVMEITVTSPTTIGWQRYRYSQPVGYPGGTYFPLNDDDLQVRRNWVTSDFVPFYDENPGYIVRFAWCYRGDEDPDGPGHLFYYAPPEGDK